jgi:hypothetical protein
MSEDQIQPSMRRLDRWQIVLCYALAALSLGAGGVAVFTSDNGAGTVALFGVAALFSVAALNGALPSRIRAGDYEAEMGRVSQIAYETGEEAGVQAVLEVATSAAEDAGDAELAHEIADKVMDYARLRSAHRNAMAALTVARADQEAARLAAELRAQALKEIVFDAETVKLGPAGPLGVRRARQLEEAGRRLAAAEAAVQRLEQQETLLAHELRRAAEGVPSEMRPSGDVSPPDDEGPAP